MYIVHMCDLKNVIISISQTSSSPYHEGCHPNVTISAIYIFSTASKMWQILASTQHKLHHLHILKVVVQMSRTLSSSYHEHRHLHITKRVIRISPTPSFTYFVLYQQSQNLWLYMSRTLPFICHELHHPNVTNTLTYIFCTVSIISRVVAFTYHEHYHPYVMNRIIRTSRTLSFRCHELYIETSRTLPLVICYSTTTSRLTNSAYIPTQSTQSHELYFIWKSWTLSSKNHSCCSTTKSRWLNSSCILTLWISMSRTISSEGHELYHLKITAAPQPQRVGGQSFEYIPPKSFQFYEIYFIWKSRTLSSENHSFCSTTTRWWQNSTYIPTQWI